jgi:hypothetical protein
MERIFTIWRIIRSDALKYAIDRLNDNFALCQDIETGEFKEIPIELLEAGTIRRHYFLKRREIYKRCPIRS